jgi:hypothetical protein
MPDSQTARLQPDQRQRLHADFLANEQSYLHMRDSLLSQYRGQWVAIHEGMVIAADTNLLKVTKAAAATGGHPYIALVGAEDTVVFRVRRVAFAYDQTYQPFPLPRVTVTFWNHAETHSKTHGDVIPDTGADLCVLQPGNLLSRQTQVPHDLHAARHPVQAIEMDARHPMVQKLTADIGAHLYA